MRRLAALAITFALLGARTPGQTSESNQPNPSTQTAKKEWAFSASAYTYLVPHAHVYVNPNFTADRGKLHLEARYNYESQETGSLWVGYNFSRGENLVFEVTPMLGGVFGELNGVAPGYLCSLTYKKLDFSSQGEYVITPGHREDSFFYTWSELGYSPLPWFRAGVVAQRTKAYETPLEVERGVLAGFTYKKASFVMYVFDLEKSEKPVVAAVVFNF
ncbi:MAG TPA: hypothetical protein VFV34_00340 [Blastocatellia bacterium]|nr:hypothetical protein [Blastocatellia bacterium]